MKRSNRGTLPSVSLVFTSLAVAAVATVVAPLLSRGWSSVPGSSRVAVQDPGAEVFISVQQLSEHVVLARVGDQPEFGQVILNNVVAIGLSSGITVVDTGYFPQSAYRLRERLVEGLPGNEFEYVVNTHWHWDHHNGNQAFADATIIAHEGIVPALELFERDFDSFLAQRRERLSAWTKTLSSAAEGSPEALEARGWAFAHARFVQEVEAGYEVIYPDITFTNVLTLRLRDLGEPFDVELLAVPPFHSDHDVLVVVPHEGVAALGDLFFPGEVPLISTDYVTDLPAFVRRMSEILAAHTSVDLFVPGHGRLMSRDEVVGMVSYLDEIIQAVEECRAADMDLAGAKRALSIENRFLYMQGRGDPATHEVNLETLWNGL